MIKQLMRLGVKLLQLTLPRVLRVQWRRPINSVQLMLAKSWPRHQWQPVLTHRHL